MDGTDPMDLVGRGELMSRVGWRAGVIVVSIAGLHCGVGTEQADAAANVLADIAVAEDAALADAGGVADEAVQGDRGDLRFDDTWEAAAPDTPGESPVDTCLHVDASADAGSGADAVKPDTGSECLPPARWWDDFALPEDPKEGIQPGPPVVKVCMEPMPKAYFDGIPCPVWGLENPDPDTPPVEAVYVWYHAGKDRLMFDPAASDGFAVRSDGVGVNWYGDPTDGFVIRLDFSLTRAQFLHFERATGKFYGESVLVPLTGPVCLSSHQRPDEPKR